MRFDGGDVRVQTSCGKFDANVNVHDHIRSDPHPSLTGFDVIRVCGPPWSPCNRVISDSRIRNFQSAVTKSLNGSLFKRREPDYSFYIRNRYDSTPNIFYCNFYSVTLRSNFPPDRSQQFNLSLGVFNFIFPRGIDRNTSRLSHSGQ